MDFSYSNYFIIILLLLLFLFPTCSKPAFDYSTLVYKSCETNNKTFNNDKTLSESFSETLGDLFQQLIAQSSQGKFFKTMEVIKDYNTAISGVFQCRDDMSTEDCFSCVNSVHPHMSNNLCLDSTSARVQLQGCYVQYETKDLSQTTELNRLEIISESMDNNNNLLHKECGEAMSGAYNVKLRELMEEAFVTLQIGIVNSNGFCRTSYKSVQLMAQCEGDYSGACECSECVSDAVLVAKEQCTASISAQIYFDKCFISYVYHSDSDGKSLSGASSNNTAKLAAIVVGGAAVLFLGFIFVSLLNSRLKKHDYE